MKLVPITENFLYQKAYASGKRFGGKYVAVYVLPDKKAGMQMKMNPEKKYINRVGLSVSKKVGNAVVRSRVRRILREGYYPMAPTLQTGKLIVLAARPTAATAKSYDIEKELRYAFKKLEMYLESDRRPTKKGST